MLASQHMPSPTRTLGSWVSNAYALASLLSSTSQPVWHPECFPKRQQREAESCIKVQVPVKDQTHAVSCRWPCNKHQIREAAKFCSKHLAAHKSKVDSGRLSARLSVQRIPRCSQLRSASLCLALACSFLLPIQCASCKKQWDLTGVPEAT